VGRAVHEGDHDAVRLDGDVHPPPDGPSGLVTVHVTTPAKERLTMTRDPADPRVVTVAPKVA
jgi:hypothetical protein